VDVDYLTKLLVTKYGTLTLNKKENETNVQNKTSFVSFCERVFKRREFKIGPSHKSIKG